MASRAGPRCVGEFQCSDVASRGCQLRLQLSSTSSGCMMYIVRSLKRQSVCWQLMIRECTSRKEILRLDIGHGHAHPRCLSFREELRNWAVRHWAPVKGINCLENGRYFSILPAYMYIRIRIGIEKRYGRNKDLFFPRQALQQSRSRSPPPPRLGSQSACRDHGTLSSSLW